MVLSIFLETHGFSQCLETVKRIHNEVKELDISALLIQIENLVLQSLHKLLVTISTVL